MIDDNSGKVLAKRCLLVVSIMSLGCRQSPSACYVSGEVVINEKPAEGVYVVFHSTELAESNAPPIAGSARTDADGNFELQVSGPGSYAMTAFWPKVIVEEGQLVEGEDQFKGRYRDLKKPVLSIEIEAGENSLPQVRLSSP